MKTAVEFLEEYLTLSFGDEIKPLRGFFVIAKETEREQMIDLVKYILKEVDFNQPQVPYEIVDLYLITDENKL